MEDKGLLSPHFSGHTRSSCIFQRHDIQPGVIHRLGVITIEKQRKGDIDNVRENVRRVMHEYTIGDRVYVEMTGI